MSPRYEVECEHHGETYRALYDVEGPLLTVYAGLYGSKSAPPGPRPYVTARHLLREIVREAKAYEDDLVYRRFDTSQPEVRFR